MATEKHLNNYFTAPLLTAKEKREVIDRNVKKRRIKEVRVQGSKERWYVLPEHLEILETSPEPQGTTLISPFDSLLWQRARAEDLLNFQYRIEIYVPEPKRVYGYYVIPILHEGQMVGRLDPKLHREKGVLEIKSLHWERGFGKDDEVSRKLKETLEDLALFVGAADIHLH